MFLYIINTLILILFIQFSTVVYYINYTETIIKMISKPPIEKIEVKNTIKNINNGGFPEENSCKNNCINFLGSIPLFISFIIAATVAFYIINLFTIVPAFYLTNVPYYTVLRLQIWRLFTSVFITTSVFNIVFIFLFWLKDASMVEIKLGTLRYSIIMMFNSLCIQCIFTLFSFIFSFLSSKKYLYSCLESPENRQVFNNGLSPMIMSEVVLLCLSNPGTKLKILCFPYEIKARYYPFIIFGILFLINSFTLDLQIVSGCVYAFIYHYYLKQKLYISSGVIKKLEAKFPFKALTKINSFIMIDNVGQPIERRTGNVSNSSMINSGKIMKNKHKGFIPFSGEGKEVGGVLGKTSEENKEYSGVGQNSEIREGIII